MNLVSPISVAVLAIMSGSEFAAGTVELEVGKNTAGTFVATPEITISQDVVSGFGVGSISLVSDGSSILVDEYSFGMETPVIGLSFGDQGDIFLTGAFDGSSLANPTTGKQSLQMSAYGVKTHVGFTDVTAKIADVSNIQFAIASEIGSLVSDYNFDDKTYAVGLGMSVTAGQVGLNVNATYGTVGAAYEVSTSAFDATVYANGAEGQILSEIGFGRSTSIANMTLETNLAYQVVAKTYEPTLTLTSSF